MDIEQQRQQMISVIESRGVTDPRVLDAMRSVPREEFVAAVYHDRAYDDCALPAAEGQTISQPYMVASMTELLSLSPTDRVLEIGTGTGYQTAVLSTLAGEVVSIERLPGLAEPAAERLNRLGYTNVEYHVGDGTLGWPDRAPYDAIIVTAGAPSIPDPLYQQLTDGGRLVIPVGDDSLQTLLVVIRRESGPEIHRKWGCRFVRLIGAAGWPDAG
ncbi:Protein-L-isoaspartate O-methyltransferase [Maioricimonas rarisocia]|uniref:Protein-L-isoaspartate O-methyltransferase n=1 Tax=Maioricimonas rarisocia TaxID=2528026 RepID=A0A517Z7Q1_9PLAN|nr:Protein-L-isoaspartate O-methyltransferase [Maioricimonas rarisocia]